MPKRKFAHLNKLCFPLPHLWNLPGLCMVSILFCGVSSGFCWFLSTGRNMLEQWQSDIHSKCLGPFTTTSSNCLPQSLCA
ncbi:hypothetical protein XENTR_v10008338 [Xenopus tropicalis]|nr:hypothetical protein XENTR_v10008338 [Xenopus tropicalis]